MTGAGETTRDVQGMPFICLPTERVVIDGKKIKVPAYCMGKTEVTIEDYFRLMPEDKLIIELPEGFDGPRQPMVNVDWYHAKRFCEKIGGSLPDKTQWYRAALGPGKGYGRSQEYATNDSTLKCGVNAQCNADKTANVGSFPDGPFGFKDLTGNVWEWMMDQDVRGGAWNGHGYGAWALRADYRLDDNPGYRLTYFGFRCVVPAQDSSGK
ncbi:MAG: SUMF1/EgtB/PvdO family nonheme iron enzyme [Pseudomonadota bacterium]